MLFCSSIKNLNAIGDAGFMTLNNLNLQGEYQN